MTDRPLQIERRRGRPRVEEPLERVSTRLPQPVYAELCREAHARETSVSQLVRHLIVLRLTDFPS